VRQYGRKRVHTVEVKGPGHQHLTETPNKSGRAKARRHGRRSVREQLAEREERAA
jgi:hypothetical protein